MCIHIWTTNWFCSNSGTKWSFKLKCWKLSLPPWSCYFTAHLLLLTQISSVHFWVLTQTFIPINHLCLLWTVWVSRFLFYNCLFFLLNEVVGSNATEWSLNQTCVLFSSLHPLQWSTSIIHHRTICNISVTLTGNCYSFHYNWNLICFL